MRKLKNNNNEKKKYSKKKGNILDEEYSIKIPKINMIQKKTRKRLNKSKEEKGIITERYKY